MKIARIDLYDELKIERKSAKGGFLNCYLQDKFVKYVNNDRKYPAMIVCPGGAYVEIHPREGEPVAIEYYSYGFSAFYLEYSLAPDSHYPTQLKEIAMAIAYIRRNAKTLGIEPDRVAVCGFSAGGHLAASIGILFDDPAISETGISKEEARPDAVVLAYPVVSSTGHQNSFNNISGNNEILKQQLSLEKRVTSESVPAFIMHTFGDKGVPCRDSLLLASAYYENGVPFTLHIYETGPHGIGIANHTAYPTDNEPAYSRAAKSWVELSVNWLAEHGIKITDKTK